MRRLFIAGNWKMNMLSKDALSYLESFKGKVKGVDDRDIVLCVPFTLLPVMHGKLPSNVALAAQDVFYEDSGAYTGEISPGMIKEYCSHVIIGHSERRMILGEQDDVLNRKILKSLSHGLKVIFCVGERLDENEKGLTKKVIERQVKAGLKGVPAEKMADVVIAYEPVWAIGTGKTATPEYAQDVHAFIRKLIRKSHGDDVAEAIRIIYGGSVKPENAASLLEKDDIDGALPGGASLDPDGFSRIIKSV